MCWPKVQTPQIIQSKTEVPSESSAEVQDAQAKERELAKKRKGRQTTILAGKGGGLLDEETTTTKLGGY